jgi:hypothetical protein
MPIDYRRDDDRRLITLTFTDPFTFEEALSQADRQSAESTWEYAVFYDLRAISRVPTTSQMHEGLSHIAGLGDGQARGPVGIAIPPRTEMLASGLQYAKTAGPRRDIEVLLTATQIDGWTARAAPIRPKRSGGER